MTPTRQFQEKADEICKKYGVPPVPVIFSKRLKSANGTYQYWNNWLFDVARTKEEIAYSIKKCRITISNLILEHFDAKTAEETLMHELAHHIRVFTAKDISHSFKFKELCVALGGTMNESLAGRTFSKAASSSYVNVAVGVVYKCTCGKYGCGEMHYVNEPRKSSLERFACPRCNAKMKHWNKTSK